MRIEIAGGRVLSPEGGFEERPLALSEGRVAEDTGAAARYRADGLLVLPGIVDLHGDAFERQIMPRPGVHFDHALALLETDRQMLANGITTAYHGLTWSWEPGLRGREAAVAFLAALEETRPHLACDTRLHLRFETYNLDAVDEVANWIEQGRVDLLAFNDHIDHIARKIDTPGGLDTYTGRSGLAPDAFRALFKRVKGRETEVAPAIQHLAAVARKKGVPMASHDDETPRMRAWYDDLGCRICEFPLDTATACHAAEKGDPIVLGAPNVLRGGSHCDRLTASEAVAQGLCSVLTSDYYYPALLTAPFRLAAEGVLSLPEAWRLVSTNPARAVGLEDRGTLSPGSRADVVVIDDSLPGLPRVAATFIAGRPVFIDAERVRPAA